MSDWAFAHVPRVGEVLESEFSSESTNRTAYVFRTHEDFRIAFVTGTEIFEDWRDTQQEADDAAEDWVLDMDPEE